MPEPVLDALMALVHPDRTCITEGSGDARRAAATLDVDTLWVVGGDGTLNEAAQGLLERSTDARPAMGIVPCGTANDYARGLGLLGADHAAAISATATLETRPMDLLQWGDQVVLNQVTVGLPAAVTSETEQPLKDALGGLA